MRAYLLGVLGEPEMESLEKRYFEDQRCLQEVKDAESALIRDYLNDRLGPDELRLFEQRYLKTPALEQLVAKKRIETRPISSPKPGRSWLVLKWVAVGICCTGLGLWLPTEKIKPSSNSRLARDSRRSNPLPLVPGVAKGNDRIPELSLSTGFAIVDLELELPGARSMTRLAGRVSLVRSDGTHLVIHETGLIPSIERNGRQQIEMTLETKALVQGDYIIELVDVKGNVQETYLLQVRT